MFTDLLALLLVLTSIHWASKPAPNRKTFGYYRIEILASFFNGALLFFVAFQIVRESIERLVHPHHVDLRVMLPIAGLGLVVNLGAAVLLHGHTHHLATRSALFHVVSDAVSSIGVILGGLLIHWTGREQIDTYVSLGIALIIVFGAYLLTRDTVDILLEATPTGIDLDRVRKEILGISGVREVHDLHVWTISSGFNAASAHIRVLNMDTTESEVIIQQISARLRDEFGVTHTTLQVEPISPPSIIQAIPV